MYRVTSGIWTAQPVAEYFEPGTQDLFPLGTIVHGVDPYWGGGEFVYGKAVAAIDAIGRLCQLTGLGLFTDVPNTANLGRPVYTNIYPMAINEFGWFQCVGNMIFQATASVAADTAFGITGAGTVGANTAGKMINGARNWLPSTNTVAKANCKVTGASAAIEVPNIAGWFHGVTLSGTGIPASSEIISINPSGREVVMSEVATAGGTVTVTATYTGYIVATCNRPWAQGAIT